MGYIGNSLYDEEGAKIVKEIVDSATAQCVELCCQSTSSYRINSAWMAK